MKSAVTLTLVSAAMAAIVARDDGHIAKEMVEKISQDVDNLHTAANEFKGDKTQILQHADSLSKNLEDGTAKFQAMKPLSLSEAMKLNSPVNDLMEKSKELAEAFISKKGEVEKNNACTEVRGRIDNIHTHTRIMMEQSVEKLPVLAKGMAKQMVEKLNASMDKVNNEFSKCKDAGVAAHAGAAAAIRARDNYHGGASHNAAYAGRHTPDCVVAETSSTATGTAQSTGTAMKPTKTPAVVTGSAAVYAPAAVFAAAAAAFAI